MTENNEYWKLRKKHGRQKKYTAESFWDSACEYFQWCDDNPWIKKEVIKKGCKAGTVVELPKTRPYSIEGLCRHLKICKQTFQNYSKSTDPDLLDIVTHAREVIWVHQFEGAVVGAFNARIVARKLGLVGKRETHITGNINNKIDGITITTTTYTT